MVIYQFQLFEISLSNYYFVLQVQAYDAFPCGVQYKTIKGQDYLSAKLRKLHEKDKIIFMENYILDLYQFL